MLCWQRGGHNNQWENHSAVELSPQTPHRHMLEFISSPMTSLRVLSMHKKVGTEQIHSACIWTKDSPTCVSCYVNMTYFSIYNTYPEHTFNAGSVLKWRSLPPTFFTYLTHCYSQIFIGWMWESRATLEISKSSALSDVPLGKQGWDQRWIIKSSHPPKCTPSCQCCEVMGYWVFSVQRADETSKWHSPFAYRTEGVSYWNKAEREKIVVK